MTYVTVLYLLMFLVFFGYVSWIWARYGTLKSISHSYYVLPKNLQFLFTLFCWGYAIPAIIIASTPLMFFAGAAICFVGAAAAYREDMTEWVHIISAMTAIILSQLSIIIDFNMWWITVGFAAITISMYLTRFFNIFPNRTWYVEILAFITIVVVLGISKL